MNKYRQLTQQITKIAMKTGILVLGAASIYFAASYYEDSIIEQKTQSENEFTQDNSLLVSLRSQMDKSGEAEKKFVELQGERNPQDFTANFATLTTFLAEATKRYNIQAPEGLTKEPEVPTDKADLKNFSYDVFVRPKLLLKFSAISDVHLFSFLNDLQHNAPGMVLINKVEIKRASASDLNDAVINNLKTGSAVALVTGSIEFTWIRLVAKDTKSGANPSASPSTP